MMIPHYFTLLRLLLGPLFLAVYVYHDEMAISMKLLPYLLFLLVVLSELSDLFDGFFARRKNQVTELGKILDPMADSIFRLSVFFTFTQGEVQLPLLLVLLFFYRDMFISTLRTLCALRGVTLGARMSGKIKAIVQAAVIFLIILLMIPYSRGAISLHTLQNVSFFAVLVACLYTLYSGAEYLFANRTYVKKAFGKA